MRWLTVLVVLAGCGRGSGEYCDKEQDCKSGLHCSMFGGMNALMCMTPAEELAACAKSKECQRDGRCGHDDGAVICKVSSADDCKKSSECAKNGRCSLSGQDDCTVGLDDDCKQAEVCKTKGLCKAGTGECVAGP